MSSAESAGAPRARIDARSRTGVAAASPNRWMLAVASALWMTFFLVPASGAPVPSLSWLAVPVCVVAMLVLPERPIVATVAVLVASEITSLDGAAYGEVEMLLPTFAALNWLGRSGRHVVIGIVAVAGFSCTGLDRC